MPRAVTVPGRALRVGLVVTRHGLAHLVRRLLPGKGPSGPQRLRRLLEDLGGVYLKLGQLLSLQPDILPPRYCRALSDLLDRVPPFAFREVEATFLEELGKRPDEIFDDFDRRPFATASIAQVHTAVLDGRPIAVKVRRPTVGRDFEPDLRLIRGLERWLQRRPPRSLAWLPGALRELDRWTREELDFRNEARVMAAVRRDAEGRDGERIPVLEADLSGPRILVAERLEGPTLLSILRQVEGGAEAPAGIDLEAVAGHIVDNFTDSALRRGLFHADLHPANLLLVPPAEAPTGSTDSTDSADSTDSTDSTDSAGAVGYVDFGIAGTLSRHSRRNLLAMILAMYQGDATGFERAFLKIAILRPGTDLEAFGRGIDRLLTEWSEDPDEGAAATAATGRKHHRLHCRFTRIMLDLLFLSRSTNLWPAPEVLRYFRSAISTDGLIQRFAPGFDVGARFHQQCRRLLTEEAVRHPFSAATVADWSAAGMRQLTQVLQPPPLTDGQPLKETGSKSRSLRRRTCRLLLLLTGCTLAAALHPAPRWGLNLFSAELTVAGVASLALVTTLYRLARGIG